MSGVTLQKAIKRFGDVQVIHGVDLQIEYGEFCVFVGPSGCGKSTLLRMVAGLEETSDGKISIGVRDVTREDPAERGVAMVFQTYALYPHMTVEENMGFGLKMNGHPKSDIKAKVGEASRILKLDDYLRRKPAALSGGQRQRVAIGRAIVREPGVFLFDEPLSNLDAELRVQMRVELAALHAQLGSTMVYVTHDQVEAMTLANKIVVLNAGRIEQVGRPLDLYTRPANRFVAGFIGSPKMNFLEGTVEGTADGRARVAVGGCLVEVPVERAPEPGAPTTLGVRPEHIGEPADGDGGARLTVEVDITEHLGGVSYVYAHGPDGSRISVERKGMVDPARGEALEVSLEPESCHLFDADGLRR